MFALFVLSLATATIAVRSGRRWLMILAISAAIVVGARALFLFEFGSGALAALHSALFFASVLHAWYNAEKLRNSA